MKPASRNFDVQGLTVARLFRQHLFGKLRPLWGFSNGLEFRHILALAVRHCLGHPIAYLTTRYERQWQRLLNGWRRWAAGLARTPPKRPGEAD